MSWSRLARVLGTLSSLVMIAAACGDDDDSAGPEVGVDVDDLADGPDLGDPLAPLEGSEVQVSGEVSEVYESDAFEIAGPDGSALVIPSSAVPEGLEEGALVQADGTVRLVVVDAFEDDFGVVYNDLYTDFVERYALAADNLVTLGLLKPGEVLSGGFVRRTDYAYPIYDLTYRGHVKTLTDFMKSFDNLVSTGRQGLFRYGNMDHSVAMGHAVARRILASEDVDHAAIAAEEEYFG